MILGWRETLVANSLVDVLALTCQRSIQGRWWEWGYPPKWWFGYRGYQQFWVDPIKYGVILSAEGKRISHRRNVRWLFCYANQIWNMIHVRKSLSEKLRVLKLRTHSDQTIIDNNIHWWSDDLMVNLMEIMPNPGREIPEIDRPRVSLWESNLANVWLPGEGT